MGEQDEKLRVAEQELERVLEKYRGKRVTTLTVREEQRTSMDDPDGSRTTRTTRISILMEVTDDPPEPDVREWANEQAERAAKLRGRDG